MLPGLSLIFITSVLIGLVNIFLESDQDMLIRFMQGILGNNISNSSIVTFVVVAVVLYVALLLTQFFIAVGLIHNIGNPDKQDYDLKNLLKTGKRFFKPTIGLAVRMMILIFPLLFIVGLFGVISSLILSILPVGEIVGIILALVYFIAFFVFSTIFFLRTGFAQLGLFVEEKRSLEAITKSVDITQGNVWNIIWKIVIVYLILGVILGVGAIVYGVGQGFLLQAVYGVEGASLDQIYTLRPYGVVIADIIFIVLFTTINTFIFTPLGLIGSITLFKSLQEVNESKSQEEKQPSNLLSRYIPKLYKLGKMLAIITIIFSLLALVSVIIS